MKLAVAVIFCLGIVSAIPHPQTEEERFDALPEFLQNAFEGLDLGRKGFPNIDEIVALGDEVVIATFEEAATRRFNRLSSNDPQDTGLNANGCRREADDVREDGITDRTRRDLADCLQNVEFGDADDNDDDFD